jgi:hypothetical protein
MNVLNPAASPDPTLPGANSAMASPVIGAFEPNWYLRNYPDVARLGMDPWAHYLTYGQAMGRLPAPAGEPSAPDTTETVPAPLPPLAEDFASASLAAYSGPVDLPPDTALPLVSVIMTAHNSAETIEHAVLSLINQSWPNLEIVVCDDRSTDATWGILRDMRRRSPSLLRIIRLEVNSGTYIAKNVAIAQARGEIILFQDSDDYSHPDRVKVQVLPLLADPELMATRTKYCRFSPASGRIIPVAGLTSRLGLITLAVRRRAFHEIGYFDAVRRAGDDEWFQRLAHLYGQHSILGLDVTLYLAELRPNSLIADMLTFNGDGSVEQNTSAQRRAYVSQFRERFRDKTCTKDWYRTHFPPVPRNPVATYPASVAALAKRRCPVFASVCSIPVRQQQLEQVVERILPQVDHLHVYLDKYPAVPPFLKDNRAITVWRSQDQGRDHRDNAKFLPYDALKASCDQFYYVTVDDDLIYPMDFVGTLLANLDRFERRVVAGLHGVVYEEEPSGYFRRRFIHHFNLGTHGPCLVNNLGTGTMAFHSDLFAVLNPRTWDMGGMVDIFMSIEARRAGAPMLCIERTDGWLQESRMPADNPTLFNEFSEKEALIVERLKPMVPWGYKGILDSVTRQDPPVRDALMRLMPKFPDAVSVKEVFGRLRGT